MNQRIGQKQQPALQAFGEQLKAHKADAEATIEAQQARDIDVEAGREHKTTWSRPLAWLGRAEKVGATKTALQEASEAKIEAAEARLAESKAVLAPLSNLVEGLSELTVNLDLPDTDLSAAYGRLRSMTAGVMRLERALAAAGPGLADMVPSAQLATLKKELSHATELAVFKITKAKEAEEAKAAAEAKATLQPEVSEARQRRLDSLIEGKGEVDGPSRMDRFMSRMRREPPPILDASHLTSASMSSPEAAAKKLGELLKDPGVEAAALKALAAVKGPAKKSLSDNLKSFAVLSDYATHSLDYREVPVGFGSPRCRRSHQARDYSKRDVRDSQPRQAQSRGNLARSLKAALAAEAPGAAVKDSLISGFFAEIGFNPEALTGRCKPSIVAIRKALDEEAFVPLRALNEGLSPRQYQGPELRKMRASVVRMTQAVVEGKLDAWKSSNPQSVAQLSHLGEDAQAVWQSNPALKSEGPNGTTLTTQEASGNELFWATKVGGPSHAFDTMNQCILSLLGNARTRAITLKDSSWHNYAARAYLRVLPREGQAPVLYLEPLQTDFPYRDHKSDVSRGPEIPQAMLKHAVAKAKEMGLGLVWARGYERAADRMGLEHDVERHTFVLEPSAVVVEASDTLGRHDWAQDGREHIRKAFSTASAQALANVAV